MKCFYKLVIATTILFSCKEKCIQCLNYSGDDICNDLILSYQIDFCKVYYVYDNDSILITKYTFNDLGQTDSIITYRENEPVTIETFDYNNSNELIESKEYHAFYNTESILNVENSDTSWIDFELVHTFKNQNNTKLIDEYYKNKELIEFTVLEKNKRDNNDLYSVYTSDSSLVYYSWYYNDNQGRNFKAEKFNSDSSIYGYANIEYKNSFIDTPSKEVRYRGDSIFYSIERIFNDCNQITKIIEKDTFNLEYNDHGLLSKLYNSPDGYSVYIYNKK